LIPVLDNEKHYWVSKDEIEKLLTKGEGWLGSHPEKDLIVSRYLKRQRSLAREALSCLLDEESVDEDADPETPLAFTPSPGAGMPQVPTRWPKRPSPSRVKQEFAAK
jgi:Hen1-like subunit of RNA repair complex